ncbi:MAG: sialate O-acetylesterase [Akkermansiaceae bacterium]|nr:sialate O-acetylesterase [Verrucomicrobiales bacterium]
MKPNLTAGFAAKFTLFTAVLLFSGVAQAEVKLASPFTSHMILQRDAKVPVWGTAAPDEEVTVEFAGQKRSIKAGTDGKWRIDLKALKVSAEGRKFTVAGSKTAQPIQLDDVVVGEVWLASGQSNMDFSMSKKVMYFAGVTNEEEEIAAANYPLIRMFTGKSQKTYEPQSSVQGEWRVCSPETAPAFSAVGYFFARGLHKDLKVPVGIVTMAFGASTAEAWIRRETLAADPDLKPMLDRFDAAVQSFKTNPPPVVAPPRSEDVSANTTTNAAGRRPRRDRSPRDPVQDQHNATVLFNGMINPIIPFAIRGAIWYQGESIVGGEAGRALYPKVQTALVKDWRKLWNQGEFPFYIVQLAGQEAASNNPFVREAQATVLDLPNTGMAVTTDIGEAKNVHPHNKQDVGDRLARIALARVYDRKIEYSGPMYKSMKVHGDKIHVRFSHLGGGLVAKGGEPLKWFTLAGEDMKFVPAQAKIEGDTVVVSSPEVAAPVAVRYAWVNFPDGCNLYNAAGLPAAQFRTDRAAK